MTKRWLIPVLLMAWLCQVAAVPRPGVAKQWQLVVHHTVGREPLILGNSYISAMGDTITVEKFKYYLSNFSLKDAGGKTTTLSPSYFLVDEADSASHIIQLAVPPGKYSTIRFMIGVDSLRNVSGIQQGPLDPMKGMFWTWNTGYIMAKLEGTSTASAIARQAYTYHVGGYRSPYPVMRWVELPVDGDGTIHLYADINRWFKGATDLVIAQTPVCHSPGGLAARIADNYSRMFSVTAP